MGAMRDRGHGYLPKGWPGTVVRLLVTLFFLGLLLLLNRCQEATSTAGGGLPSPEVTPLRGRLVVEVRPAGAVVAVNGREVGGTPLALDLEPGTHTVVVSLSGYLPLSETVKLRAGKDALVRGELENLLHGTAATPTVTPSVALPATQESPPPAPTRTASPTAAPSPSPLPSPPPAASPVQVREGSVEVQSYPWAEFLRPVWQEAYGLEILALDRSAYEAANPQSQSVAYRSLTLENDLLRLTFLPELGGRLYRLAFKKTGNEELYANPVLKPSPWGPPEQGGWLAAGGIEWGLPVEEHGYLWGTPWEAQVARSQEEATVVLIAPAGDRLQAQVAVTLRGGMVEVRPRFENISGTPLDLKFWINAMLAPGPANSVSPDLHFVMPEGVEQVIVHSRGDSELPAPGQPMSWPVYAGRNLSRLGNWNRWLGFFAPDPPVGFAAVYDLAVDEGMVRVFPPEVARGVKGFAFGWASPIDPTTYTDDGSAYVELHGGLAPTFGDVYALAPGEVVTWSEWWYPVAGLGGIRYANRHAALNLEVQGESIALGLAAPADLSALASLRLDDALLWEGAVAVQAGDVWLRQVPLPAERPERGRLALRLHGSAGELWAEYESEFVLR